MFADVAEIRADPSRTLVYAEGWQSWSPVGARRVSDPAPKPSNQIQRTMGFRPGKPLPPNGAQGEGLLALAVRGGPVRVFAAPDPARQVPSIRVRSENDRLTVSADADVSASTHEGTIMEALAAWAESLGRRRLRPIGAGWCSWYCYWQDVREEDVLANLAAMERLELPVEIVQIDDGHQATVGDWLDRSARFGALDGIARRIHESGRIAGIWLAPFLVGASSKLASEHPDWLVDGADAGFNWRQGLRVLDVSHRDAAEHLLRVARSFANDGFSYFKLDFLYAGAIPGIDAYREGLRIVREGAGDDAVLLGCGAPLLPSIGLVDAMRIGPDIGVTTGAVDAAIRSVRSRAWMHGRFWINDPDCLIVRAELADRERWAEQVEACGGLVFSSDPIDELDERGLELTRRGLRHAWTAPPDPRRSDRLR